MSIIVSMWSCVIVSGPNHRELKVTYRLMMTLQVQRNTAGTELPVLTTKMTKKRKRRTRRRRWRTTMNSRRLYSLQSVSGVL
jgi:hypothetical protein